jgi:hypothetical protein
LGDGVLIVATDGFFNYVKTTDLVQIISAALFCELPRKLLSMVRLRSGELWDDVGIIVCRQRPRPRPRKRYTITAEDMTRS